MFSPCFRDCELIPPTLGSLTPLPLLPRHCASRQIPDPTVDLSAAARYARETYSGLTRRSSNAQDTAGYLGHKEVGAQEEEEQRGAGGNSGAGGVKMMLDISISAPNIYLFEKVHGGRTTAPVLLVRLGELCIQDAEREHHDAAPGTKGADGPPLASRYARAEGMGGGRQGLCNRHRLVVSQVGVDLLHGVKLPLGDGDVRVEGARSSIIADTRLCADLALELPDSGSSSSSSGTKSGRALEVDATLDTVDVQASAADLCDMVRIAASWAPQSSLADR